MKPFLFALICAIPLAMSAQPSDYATSIWTQESGMEQVAMPTEEPAPVQCDTIIHRQGGTCEITWTQEGGAQIECTGDGETDVIIAYHAHTARIESSSGQQYDLISAYPGDDWFLACGSYMLVKMCSQ